MHTITGLRKALGLSTANQVRNRIEAVRDVLDPHLRRGPNNQILLTDEGLALLRQLQELYDSGLRMNEASDVLRATAYNNIVTPRAVVSGFASHPTTRDETGGAARASQDEIVFLRTRLAELEGVLSRPLAAANAPAHEWWMSLREDLDVA